MKKKKKFNKKTICQKIAWDVTRYTMPTINSVIILRLIYWSQCPKEKILVLVCSILSIYPILGTNFKFNHSITNFIEID